MPKMGEGSGPARFYGTRGLLIFALPVHAFISRCARSVEEFFVVLRELVVMKVFFCARCYLDIADKIDTDRTLVGDTFAKRDVPESLHALIFLSDSAVFRR